MILLYFLFYRRSCQLCAPEEFTSIDITSGWRCFRCAHRVEDDHFLHWDPDATERQKYSSPHSRRCHEADLNFPSLLPYSLEKTLPSLVLDIWMSRCNGNVLEASEAYRFTKPKIFEKRQENTESIT